MYNVRLLFKRGVSLNMQDANKDRRCLQKEIHNKIQERLLEPHTFAQRSVRLGETDGQVRRPRGKSVGSLDKVKEKANATDDKPGRRFSIMNHGMEQTTMGEESGSDF